VTIRAIRSPLIGCMLCGVVMLVLCAVSFAQSPIDEIHVVPRVAVQGSTGQIDASLDTHTKPIKKEVDLVLVSVTITDPMDRLVTGLEQDNFQVFDSKQLQEIKHFSSEDTPVSIGVIFDTSGSMKSKIEPAREAVLEFLRTANPQDEFFMITFADQPEEVQRFHRLSRGHPKQAALYLPQGTYGAVGRDLSWTQ
jgi:Ca-activated chloride channel homolog